tara:strand:+ start:547 stop:1089 length:543 start_codon:yes stop_codon:yes gene_type:complete
MSDNSDTNDVGTELIPLDSKEEANNIENIIRNIYISYKENDIDLNPLSFYEKELQHIYDNLINPSIEDNKRVMCLYHGYSMYNAIGLIIGDGWQFIRIPDYPTIQTQLDFCKLLSCRILKLIQSIKSKNDKIQCRIRNYKRIEYYDEEETSEEESFEPIKKKRSIMDTSVKGERLSPITI